MISTKKPERLLWIHENLQYGKTININNAALEFNVSTRTIQRDLNDIRYYYANEITKNGNYRSVEFDYVRGGYILK